MSLNKIQSNLYRQKKTAANAVDLQLMQYLGQSGQSRCKEKATTHERIKGLSIWPKHTDQKDGDNFLSVYKKTHMYECCDGAPQTHTHALTDTRARAHTHTAQQVDTSGLFS